MNAKEKRARYRIGQVFYRATVFDDATCEVEELRIRTIRKPYAYAIAINSVTWGKRSTQNGDFGFIDPIPDFCRVKFRTEPYLHSPDMKIGLPANMKTTKAAAIRHVINTPSELRWLEDDERAKVLKTLKGMLTRATKKKEASR